MRIGIDARILGNTGVGRYLQQILIHLARIDKQNEYLVFVNKDNPRVVTQENVKWIPLKISVPIYSLREQYWLPIEIRKWPLDLIHFGNFDMPLIHWYPYVVTVHDLIY
jgi:hypothetical protein